MFEDILTKEILEADYSVGKLSKAEIARKYKTTVATINKYFKIHGIKNNTRADYVSDDLSEEKFGRLKPKSRAENDKHGKSRWLCECDCGKTKIVNACSLVRGLSESCGCLKSELSRTGYRDISGSWWRRTVESAAKRGYEFSITIEDAWSAWEKQGGLCALTGIPIAFGADSNKIHERTASVDRKDSNKGYTKDNIQIVHKTVNMVKSWLPEDKFIAVCNLVAKNRPVDHETSCWAMNESVVCKKLRK